MGLSGMFASHRSRPRMMKKFEATFESYWSEAAFETYDPAVHGDRLDEALREASGSAAANSRSITLSGLEVRPYPHQQDMLERL